MHVCKFLICISVLQQYNVIYCCKYGAYEKISYFKKRSKLNRMNQCGETAKIHDESPFLHTNIIFSYFVRSLCYHSYGINYQLPKMMFMNWILFRQFGPALLDGIPI